MQAGGVDTFVKAEATIWFWPSAALGYYLITHDSPLVLATFLVSVLTGAMTYRLHTRIRERLDLLDSFQRRRQRVSRERVEEGEPLLTSLLTSVEDLVIDSAPDHRFARWVVVVGTVTSMLLFAGLWVWLGTRVLAPEQLGFAGLGLFALPLLLLANFAMSFVFAL